MNNRVLNGISVDAFERKIAHFIEQSEPDTMSFVAFEEAAQALLEETTAERVELTGVVENGKIAFEQPPSVPIIVLGNEIVIGGLRLVIRLRPREHGRLAPT